jgi:hypothetical protein
MRKIYVLYASIRPDDVKIITQQWLNNCINKDIIYFNICMANDEQKAIVESFNIHQSTVISAPEKTGYCHAITKLTMGLEADENDILITACDDILSPTEWDLYLFKRFETFDDCIFICDGNSTDSNIITVPAMTFKCLKKINKILYNPAYHHFFCDNELYNNLTELGLLQDNRRICNEHNQRIDPVEFTHRHYYSGSGTRPDKHDNYNQSLFTQDAGVFLKRTQMPVEERIKG